MPDTLPPQQNVNDRLFPSSQPGQNPGTSLKPSSGGVVPPRRPLTPRQAEGPENPNDRRLRRGLLIAGVTVGFLFIAILVIAVISSAEGPNTILRQIGVEGDINDILLRVVNFVFGIAGIIAIIAIVIGAFIYIASLGDQREKRRARRILIASVVTLIVLLLSYILIYSLIRTNQDRNKPAGEQEQKLQILTNPSPAEGSAPLTIGFDITNLAQGSYFFSWEFGDGEKGTGKPIVHTYQREGNYTVQVVISSGTSVVATLTSNVIVSNTRPKPFIIAEPVSGKAPLKVDFDASQSEDLNGEILKYEWEFGDSEATTGNSNTAQGVRVTHTYSSDGFFEATLTVTDNNGESQSVKQTIEVGVEPNAPTAVITTTPAATGFAPLTVKGIQPFKVNFSASKSRDNDGQITKYRWDFGDGSPAEEGQAVIHTFPEGGTYTTTLTVTDNDEKQDEAQVAVVVGSPDQVPHAVITATPPPTQTGEIRGDVPLTVTLNGSKSTDSDGEIILYEWNLGDNSPLLAGEEVSYTYTKVGTYTVALTVTDEDGYSNVEPATIVVRTLPAGDKAPVASIKTDPVDASGNVPFTVNFDGSESYDDDGTIISYEWDFGDGRTILSGAQVTHVYDSPGIFTVRLVVHDNSGLTGEDTVPVAAQVAAPIARIEANRTSGTAPLTVFFDATTSSGNIRRYNWDFGDGSTGQGRTPSHTFNIAGDFTVTLTVTDTVEQVDTETIAIEVF